MISRKATGLTLALAVLPKTNRQLVSAPGLKDKTALHWAMIYG